MKMWILQWRLICGNVPTGGLVKVYLIFAAQRSFTWLTMYEVLRATLNTSSDQDHDGIQRRALPGKLLAIFGLQESRINHTLRELHSFTCASGRPLLDCFICEHSGCRDIRQGRFMVHTCSERTGAIAAQWLGVEGKGGGNRKK